MSAYISRSWESADSLTYGTTTETNDSANVQYFVFDAADESAALAALRANAPATYAMGDKTLALSSISLTGRLAETIWSGAVDYSGATGAALGGSFAFSAAPVGGTTIGVVLDLITPAAARTGGAVSWYIGGAYQASAATFDIPAGSVGAEILAIYTHPNYTGEIQKSGTIGDAETLGGSIAIIGNPPPVGADPVTLTADLTEVTPSAAQTGGTYVWTQNGVDISTTGTATVSLPLPVQLVYAHPDYRGQLKASTATSQDSGNGSKDTTISFNISQSTTTKTAIGTGAIQSSGAWAAGGYAIRGYNPDNFGNPQGAEFAVSAMSVTYALWRPPSYFTQTFLNRLESYVNCLNSGPFLGYPEKCVMFVGVTGNRSGSRAADWWQIGLTFQIKRGQKQTIQMFDGTRQALTTKPETIETKSGWDYLNVMFAKLPVSGQDTVAAVAWNVCREYKEKDFDWLAEEINRKIS